MEKLQLHIQSSFTLFLPEPRGALSLGSKGVTLFSEQVWGLLWDACTHGTFQGKLLLHTYKSVPGWPSVT